jgi:hypothetical protein
MTSGSAQTSGSQFGWSVAIGRNLIVVGAVQAPAVGGQLADGETITADWVISAADGHATIFDLLGGKYTDRLTDDIYCNNETFDHHRHASIRQ